MPVDIGVRQINIIYNSARSPGDRFRGIIEGLQ